MSSSTDDQDYEWLFRWVLLAVCVIATIVFTRIVTYDAQAAEKSARALGFTDLILESTPAFPEYNGCSSDDTSLSIYKATAPSGDRVRIAVCNGIFKGYTVRVL